MHYCDQLYVSNNYNNFNLFMIFVAEECEDDENPTSIYIF